MMMSMPTTELGQRCQRKKKHDEARYDKRESRKDN